MRFTNPARIPSVLLTGLILAMAGASIPSRLHAQTVPALVHSVPAFTLKDTDGKERDLKAYHGQPVVLYFFCPCADCHRVAEMWGQVQRGMASPTNTPPPDKKQGPPSETKPAAPPKPPQTLVVFAGEAEDARAFRDTVGLEAAQTTLLVDSDSKVAQTYDAIPCPRVFVLDASGILRYTNRQPNAKTSEIVPATVVSRITDTLRAIAKQPINAKPVKPNPSTPAQKTRGKK